MSRQKILNNILIILSLILIILLYCFIKESRQANKKDNINKENMINSEKNENKEDFDDKKNIDSNWDIEKEEKLDKDNNNEDTWDEPNPVILGFAGDILFADNSVPINKYDSVGKGVDGILNESLIKRMKNADIMMLNNEFAYSTRGKKIPGKKYTFRAHPDRVNILHEMGVDIVSLANNHALDYGHDALLDTFQTLTDAKIDYVGAGENIDRAKEAIYYNIEGKTIAYLSASRVIYAGDWYATDERAGMLGTYDPEILINQIKIAKEKSDYLVVYVHWGIESDNMPQNYQKELAYQYIDAGADAVIGAHPHVMQGFEYYKNKPIIYSLGNFWFSSYKRESGMIEIIIEDNNTVKTRLLPVMTGDCYTYLLEDQEDIAKYYKYMEEISFNVRIDKDGFIFDTLGDGS